VDPDIPEMSSLLYP